MDKNQFEELIMTIINGFNDIKDAINKLEKSLQKSQKNVNIKQNDDYYGIPLNSVHHPNNPEMIASPIHKWDEKIKMWRKN